MATIKFGAIVTDMRGKLGGHVFQKGNQSRVMKTSTSPRQNRTSIRNVQQLILDTIRNQWRNLTTAVRNDWSIASQQFYFPSTFGDKIILSGYQLYIKLWMAYLRAGYSSTIAVNNLNPNVDYFYMSKTEIDNTLEVLDHIGVGLESGNRFVYLTALGSSLGATPNISKFTYLRSASVPTSASENTYNSLEVKYGDLNTEPVIWIAVFQVNKSGFASSPAIIKATYV